MNSPAWLSRQRDLLTADSVRLTEQLLRGKMNAESRWYDTSILDLSYNENPLGPSPRAVEAVRQSAGALNLYPLVSAPRLRRRLADHHGIAEENVVVGCGATELIGMLAQLALEPGDRGAYSRSSLFAYRRAIEAARGVAVETPLTSAYCHDVDSLLSAASAGARIIFVSNPHNPSGTILTDTDIMSLLGGLTERTLLVMDEAYADFVESPEFPQSLEYAVSQENVIVLRTFSKVYGLAGARVGYAVGIPKVIAALDSIGRSINPGGVGLLGQVAAEAALGDTVHVRRSVDHVQRERAHAFVRLSQLGFPSIRSQGNFVMMRAGDTAESLVRFLAERGVLVCSGAYFGHPDQIRFSIPKTEELARFLSLLADFRASS